MSTEKISLNLSNCELGLPAGQAPRPEVTEVDTGVWIVDNVLSSEECESIIHAAEKIGMEQDGPKTEFRNRSRAIFFCPDASSLVWRRLQHLPLFNSAVTIAKSDTSYHQPPLEGVAGTWDPEGLNICWRVCQYPPTGHFAPHFDSGAPPIRSTGASRA